ncbi:hypothetical protein AB0D42_08315 [Streptomyces sp. NPDC048304]|uniref:hypothetical protein n=1 Tax=Streptomyces sp. NPDC048304 TaxID=3154820 RepID=UPI00340D4203
MIQVVGWTVRHPRWTFAARAALTVVLAGLVTLEGVVLSRQPSLPHAVVWIAGIAVCLCLIPYRGLSLTVRGTVAAAVSWVATAILVLHEHPLVVWGMGESFALLVLFSAVLRRSEAKVAALLGPMLGLAAVAAPARDADLGVFTLFFGLLTAVISRGAGRTPQGRARPGGRLAHQCLAAAAPRPAGNAVTIAEQVS